MYNIFDDIETFTRRNFRYQVKVGKKLYVFKWKERTIREMIPFLEAIESRESDSNLEKGTCVEQAVFRFLNEIYTGFTEEKFKQISQDDFNRAIDNILEPLSREDDRPKKKGEKITSSIQSVVRLSRQFMNLMRHSNGSFTHESILDLTFTQLYDYNNALERSIMMESPEGQKEIKVRDKLEEIIRLGKKGVDAIKEKHRLWKERRKSNDKNNGKKN